MPHYLLSVPKPLDSSRRKKKKQRITVPMKCLERSMVQCEKYLTFLNHEDIDQPVEVHFTTLCWLLRP